MLPHNLSVCWDSAFTSESTDVLQLKILMDPGVEYAGVFPVSQYLHVK